jgi:RNA polymerase sigma-70 factor (family 1)
MHEFTTFSDLELIDLVNRGEEFAFKQLFDRYWGASFLHAVKLLGNEDEAKDVVQEVFLSIWQRSGTLTNIKDVPAFIFSAVRNRVLNLIRDSNVRLKYIELFSLYIDAHHNKTLDLINEKDMQLSINKALNSLPLKMREVFELSRDQHFTHKEIAGQLSISEKTVKRQISNALAILRVQLQRPLSIITILLSISIK